MRPGLRLFALIAVVPLLASAEEASRVNGFALDSKTIDVSEVLRGGPPRDGIPALDAPRVLPASGSPWHDDEMVLAVELGGEARAYPVAILNWHELVNDQLGDTPILVSYCPLCGTGVVFERRVGDATLHFGVSGLLYRSDVLFYDRESESLWSQIRARAVTAPRDGAQLRILRSTMTHWGTWRTLHPNSSVLSLETGHSRDYQRDPYEGYATSEQVMFPAPLDGRYHPKMPTLGVRTPDGVARAYTAEELSNAGGRVEETFEGRAVEVSYDPAQQVFDVEAPVDLDVIEGYWFAWAAFHPSTSVFVAVPVAGDPTSATE